MTNEQAPQPQAPPAKDVFISYASQDKAVADEVCESLERAGVACWIAPRNVTPGEFYAESIVHAIDSTKVIVLVLSKSGADSQHVLREVERASSKRHPVLSFRIDTAAMPAGLEYFLNSSQWLDASTAGVNHALPKLVDAVKIALTQPSTEARLETGASTTAKVSSRRSGALVALAVITMAALAYVVADKFWLSKRVASLPSPAATASPTSSIAVLPFTDMSEKHDQEYFGDGMAEEILNLLAKIPGLTVIGRTSSFQFKGKNEDLRTIGSKLNAAYVLEGSVRTAGDDVRVTAQLINTTTGAHEWSESYERHIGDVLKLQDAIAATVARQLELTVPVNASALRASLKSVEAYKLLLRAWHAWDRQDKEGFEEGANLMRQALRLDPTSVLATADLAWIYESQAEFGFAPPAEGFERARRTALAALTLDPNSVDAHGVLARIHVVYDWDWPAADREYQQVAMLAPGSEAAFDRGDLTLALGRWDEALSDAKAALKMDPLGSWHYLFLSWVQARRDDLPAAEAAARRTLDISPTYAFAHYYLGLVLIARGDRAGALAEMEREVDDGARISGLALAYQALGRKAESNAALARMLKEQAQDNAFGIAEVYAARGQAAEAVRWLERAYAQKDASLFYVKGDLPLKSIESDPRYKAFLRKMNLPE
jgi:TolB-like protein/Tfp pilus assembly protein PilF